MGTSAITITALTATPTLRGNKLRATVLATGPAANLPNLTLKTVVFLSSIVNNYATATEIARGNPEALDAGLIEEQTYYYWAYAVDASDNVGAVFPVSPTAGVACTAIGMSGIAFGLANGKLVATVAGNALTIAIKTAAGNDPSSSDPVYLAFRNATLSIGNYAIRSITSALQLVISSGSTMGVPGNNLPFRLWIAIFDDGGTLKLGAVNASHATNGIIFPVADMANAPFTGVDNGSGSATTIGYFYTNSALTNKTFRVIGYMDFSSGLAAVGTWTSAPNIIRLGGQGIILPGSLVQEISSPEQGFFGTNAPTIPYDDTTPQYAEGIVRFALSLQPSSACSFFDIEYAEHVSLSGAELVTLALFKDGATNANAIAVSAQYIATANQIQQIRFRHRVQAGSTSVREYSMRIGTASGVTISYRGAAGASKFNGLLTDFIRVAEVMG